MRPSYNILHYPYYPNVIEAGTKCEALSCNYTIYIDKVSDSRSRRYNDVMAWCAVGLAVG